MAMVLNHLQTVARNSDKNKMPLDQLAVCLGPVLLCPSPSSSDNADLEFKKHIEVLKYLLEIWTEQNGMYLHIWCSHPSILFYQSPIIFSVSLHLVRFLRVYQQRRINKAQLYRMLKIVI